jgi:hypothetical protein
MNTNVKVKLALSHEQALKLKRAHKANRSVTIRLAHNQLFSSNGIEVELTGEQYKKVISAYKSKAGRGVQITFETHQVGGIFPFLIPLLAALGGIAAKVAPIAVRAAAAGAKVASSVAKVAPQIAKVGAKVVANPTVRTLAKGVATGVATAAGEQAVGAIINKINGPAPVAEAPVVTQEGQGFFYPSSRLGYGMVPMGGRGLVPLGSQRGRGGKSMITYASKKKASR